MDCNKFYEGNKNHDVKQSNWEKPLYISWSKKKKKSLYKEKLHLSQN